MILVAGTGRCGTLSTIMLLEQAGLTAEHEPHREWIPAIVPFWLSGGLSLEQTAGWLGRMAWGEAAGFYLFPALIEPLSKVFPEAVWLWPTRNPWDTVASMLHMGWYDRRDDDAWPLVLMAPTPGAAQVARVTAWAPWGCRPNPVMVGEMGLKEWSALPQPARCAWWWGWVWQRMRSLEPCCRFPVEARRPDLPLEWLGLPKPPRDIVANHNGVRPKPLTVEERELVRPWVADGFDDLYPAELRMVCQ